MGSITSMTKEMCFLFTKKNRAILDIKYIYKI